MKLITRRQPELVVDVEARLAGFVHPDDEDGATDERAEVAAAV